MEPGKSKFLKNAKLWCDGDATVKGQLRVDAQTKSRALAGQVADRPEMYSHFDMSRLNFVSSMPNTGLDGSQTNDESYWQVSHVSLATPTMCTDDLIEPKSTGRETNPMREFNVAEGQESRQEQSAVINPWSKNNDTTPMVFPTIQERYCLLIKNIPAHISDSDISDSLIHHDIQTWNILRIFPNQDGTKHVHAEFAMAEHAYAAKSTLKNVKIGGNRLTLKVTSEVKKGKKWRRAPFPDDESSPTGANIQGAKELELALQLA